jgi:TetR/AcrR family transcriptional repressor of nem operon
MNTKEHILSVGQKLMLQKGFNATTIDDICKAAKTTKGGFFHYFKNKSEFAEELTRYYWKNMNEYFSQASFRKSKKAFIRVCSWIDYLANIPVDTTENDSCIIGNFSQEVAHAEPKIREACSLAFKEWAQEFKKDLDTAVKESKKKIKVSTQDLANQMLIISEGGLLLAKAHKNPKIYKKSLQLFKRQIVSLFK